MTSENKNLRLRRTTPISMLIEISLGRAEEEENGLIHPTGSFDEACGSEF